MNELIELIKHFKKDKNIYVTIDVDYFAPYDAYEIEMYDEHHIPHPYHVSRLVYVNDLLSAKIPTHEVFVKILNEMYEELKGVETKNEREKLVLLKTLSKS